MNNSIVSFVFNDRSVRTAQKDDGSIWFCLADVLSSTQTKTTIGDVKLSLIDVFGEGHVINLSLETTTGIQDAAFISESGLTFLLSRSRTAAGKALNKFIHCEVLPSIRKTGSYSLGSIEPKVPQTYGEALIEAGKLAIENERLIKEAEFKDAHIEILEEETERQAEIIDELFDYSSIIRIAKYNGCGEKAFNWRNLKTASVVLKLEIKQAPCPRFVTKNLYHHDAWRLAYPGYRMPETTTLVINEIPKSL
jgi:prophage antirepressor-like protein